MKFLSMSFIAPIIAASNLDLLISRVPFLKVPVRIFAYHRVREIDNSTMPYERELISATPAQFEEQLKFLTRHYTLTNFKEIGRKLDEEPGYKPENLAVLTFDDGYSDFYTEIFPLLRKYNATAVVYPSTQYIESDTAIWFDQLGFILDSLKDNQIEGAINKIRMAGPFSAVGPIDKGAVFRVVKALPDTKRLEFMASIISLSQREFGIDVAGIKNEMLSWSQVCEVSKHGIEVGSHTVSHPILANLSEESLKLELEKSKETIENKTGERVVSLAYPVGGYETFSDVVIDAVKAAGYEFSVCYLDGVDGLFQRGMYELKRIRVEENQSLALFRTRLALLPLKRVLKR